MASRASSQSGAHREPLGRIIAALEKRGMLENTVVYCAGEFGRTPKINKNSGRDHWARSMAVVLAGGGFKGGYVHGATDQQGMAPAIDACTPDAIRLCQQAFPDKGRIVHVGICHGPNTQGVFHCRLSLRPTRSASARFFRAK